MNNKLSMIKNILFTIGILAIFFVASLVIEYYFKADTLIPAAFALAVFLISLYTDGFAYGVIASFFSVLALNFAFTFPFF